MHIDIHDAPRGYETLPIICGFVVIFLSSSTSDNETFDMHNHQANNLYLKKFKIELHRPTMEYFLISTCNNMRSVEQLQ